MRRGFTLLELSVALVLTGLVTALFLKISDKSDTASCYVTTKKQIETIKDAVERFAMKHDRFPIPAVRNAGVEDKLYGREAATVADVTISITNNTPLTVIDDVNGALFGALPFQALGIPVENASDCWGNKYTYAVTKELTDPAKFLDNNTLGKLSIKTTPSITFLAEAGYAIISHGADELGAVKNNYAHATDRKWCNLNNSLISTYNCSRTNNLISAEFNDGKDGAEKFFDDVIVYRGKPWRITPMNGVCGTSVNSCTSGTLSVNNSGSGCQNRAWSCLGQNGGTDSNCFISNPCKLCGNTYLSCLGGTASGVSVGTCGGSATWYCIGNTNTGDAFTEYCSLPNPPCPPACGSMAYTCNSGLPSTTYDGVICGTAKTWNCVNGASTAACAEPYPLCPIPLPVNGSCGASSFTCNNATFPANYNYSTGAWECWGLHGGSDVSCKL